MRHSLRVYDTKTRTKKIFSPRGNTVQMYVCGPTVYDRAHLGNARSVVVFDVLYRLLKEVYGTVKYVRNITDIDDKIIDAAQKNQEPIESLTKRTLGFFHQDMAALGTLPPTHEPLATQHVSHMIKLIETLLRKDVAYRLENQVMFHVKHYSDYGSLSGRLPESQRPGARVQIDTQKREALDFVLWKPSQEGEPGWESPWGYGRPGWHIECSAMSHAFLDLPFDIHGGGQDLIFPHHENEQAQSCCGFDQKELASFWVHNGILTVNGEKMSKSLGNFTTVSDSLVRWPGEVIRWVLLSTHYRHPLDWIQEKLQQAKTNLDRIYGALQENTYTSTHAEDLLESPFGQALLDDLNTPLAFKHLFDIVRALHQATKKSDKQRLTSRLYHGARLLGFCAHTPKAWFQKASSKAHQITPKLIEKLIEKRSQARKEGDFQKADAIRNHLKQQGVSLEDKNEKTHWKRV